jgi:hypothetical protein
VLVFALAVALERRALGLSNDELAGVIVAGAGAVVLARILLAVRLRARGGDLS